MTVLTTIGDYRVCTDDGAYTVESRSGRSWSREAGYDGLDQAIETAARKHVERRMRSAHSEIPLDYEHSRGSGASGTRLVYSRGRWTMQTCSMRGGTTERGSWPTIYSALLSPRRRGAKHRDLAGVRLAVCQAHVAAVVALRDALTDPLVNSAVSDAPEADLAPQGPTGPKCLTDPHKSCWSGVGQSTPETLLDDDGAILPAEVA